MHRVKELHVLYPNSHSRPQSKSETLFFFLMNRLYIFRVVLGLRKKREFPYTSSTLTPALYY